jgi:hypothetical protein
MGLQIYLFWFIVVLFIMIHFHINQNIIKQKIQHRQNSSKINSNNPRNRGQIDTLNTNIHDRSRS